MALTFGFYDSLNHDRLYNAQQMSAIFDGIINDGVFASVGSHFSVVPGTGMHVLVKSGRAWFNSTWTLNDSDIDLTIDAADSLLGRIDTVVLEVNSEQATRANSIKVVKGTAASTPAKPTLTNTTTVHQHPLAHITVAKNTTAITASMIEIVVGKTDCPFVTAILQTTDITNLFAKWENDFQTWFSTVRSTLDGDVALNLQNQIDANWRNTLKDATKTKLGLASDAVPDDAFNALIEDVSTTFDIGDVKTSSRKSLGSNWVYSNGASLPYCDYQRLYDNGDDRHFYYKELAADYPLGTNILVKTYTGTLGYHEGQDTSSYTEKWHTSYAEPYIEKTVTMDATFVDQNGIRYGLYLDNYYHKSTGYAACAYLYSLDSQDDVKTPVSYFPLQDDIWVSYPYSRLDCGNKAGNFICLVNGVAMFSKTITNDSTTYIKLFFWDINNYQVHQTAITRHTERNYIPFYGGSSNKERVDVINANEHLIIGGYYYNDNYLNNYVVYVNKSSSSGLAVKVITDMKYKSNSGTTTNELTSIDSNSIYRYVPSLDAYVEITLYPDNDDAYIYYNYPILEPIKNATVEIDNTYKNMTCAITLANHKSTSVMNIGNTFSDISSKNDRFVAIRDQIYWTSSKIWINLTNKEGAATSIIHDNLSGYQRMPTVLWSTVKDGITYLLTTKGLCTLSGEISFENLIAFTDDFIWCTSSSPNFTNNYETELFFTNGSYQITTLTITGKARLAAVTPTLSGVSNANSFIKIKN